MNILINILTHGDELIGVRVVKEIKKLKIKKQFLKIQIANKVAYTQKRRFIDEDLNRVFPGCATGSCESKLAHKLSRKIKNADLVIDIHSTKSGLRNSLIVTKLDKPTRDVIFIIQPNNVLVMRVTETNALISGAKIGLAFEYGKDESVRALKNIITDIKRIFIYFGLLEGSLVSKKTRTFFFNVDATVLKPKGFVLTKNIKNFRLVKKGSVYATYKNKVLKAKKSFIPILFSNKGYQDIFGFSASFLDQS